MRPFLALQHSLILTGNPFEWSSFLERNLPEETLAFCHETPSYQSLADCSKLEGLVRDLIYELSPTRPLPLPSSQIFLGQSPWRRSVDAERAEFYGSDDKGTSLAVINQAEERAWHEILAILDTFSTFPERVVFIHSSLLVHPSPHHFAILPDLLNRIKAAGLHAPIFVLHYGRELSGQLEFSQSSVHVIAVSRLTSLFELPSINLLHRFACHIERQGKGAQILYLHTKGISYTQPRPGVEDWKDLMLYFLLQRHKESFHILKSEAFDVVGAMLLQDMFGRYYFGGNYWWATTNYLARLKPLNYSSTKYAAEYWLLGSPSVRIYAPDTLKGEEIRAVHYRSRYPPHCYRSLRADEGIPPSLPTWKASCQRLDPKFNSQDEEEHVRMEYEYLHGRSTIPENDIRRTLEATDGETNSIRAEARDNVSSLSTPTASTAHTLGLLILGC
eukprot:scaffold537_cov180-Ochromonas_danica.AAC.35